MDKAFILTARTDSSRLSSKIIKKIHKKLRVIDIIIKRAKKINLPIILATTQKKSDDFLCSYVKRKYKIIIFRGNNLSKIKRWHQCFKKYNIKYACIVEGDDPLFDYNIYKKEIQKKIKHEILTCPKDIITGNFFYIISRKGLAKLKKFTERRGYNNVEIIDPLVKMAKLKKKTIAVKKIFRKKNIRLTLDYHEDYILIKKIINKFGYLVKNDKVVNFLIKNKDLSSINYFREKYWVKKQLSIIKKFR
tara:strand:- start:633 stop:1376 length:744 start_codon:yes stop_codon:yes gene_type:complete